MQAAKDDEKKLKWWKIFLRMQENENFKFRRITDCKIIYFFAHLCMPNFLGLYMGDNRYAKYLDNNNFTFARSYGLFITKY